MGRRINRTPHGIKVSVYDPQIGQSVSFTVYGAVGTSLERGVDVLARKAHEALSAHYKTTSLNDRRHKRR